MDIGAFLGSLNVVDVVIGLALFGAFILGYAQGAVRRGLGILTMSVAFFLAGQINQWFGRFLAEHWVQNPIAYSYMIGYLVLFLALTIAGGLLVQATYHKTEVLARWPIVDEVLGGLLGVGWGLLFLMYVVMILDTYFRTAGVGDASEAVFLRSVWTLIDDSWFGGFLHTQVIPTFVAWTSFLLPASLVQLYR